MLVEDRLWKALKATLWNLDIFVLYMNLLEGSGIITTLRCICGSGVHKRNLQYFFERNNTGSSWEGGRSLGGNVVVMKKFVFKRIYIRFTFKLLNETKETNEDKCYHRKLGKGSDLSFYKRRNMVNK